MAIDERCAPCATGRRDGQPCDISTCRCRCHREGKAVVAALADTTLNKARKSRPSRRIGLNYSVKQIEINVKDFTKELHKSTKKGGQMTRRDLLISQAEAFRLNQRANKTMDDIMADFVIDRFNTFFDLAKAENNDEKEPY